MTSKKKKSPSLRISPETTRPIRRVWEFGYNTCHAPTVMRTDMQNHMRRAHEELGMKYWRCHGTLSDDVGIVYQDEKGRQHWCFSGLKRIIDAGLATGAKPFLELSFMPSALASNPNETITYYRGITSPPSDFRRWAELIEKTMRFLAETYGLKELHTWYFEIWNEPNIPFWTGTQAEYFQLYRSAALAIKKVDPKLRVGGPSTARAAWVADLLAYCSSSRTPLDFLSTHIYPSDVPFMEEAHGKVQLLGLDFLRDHFVRIRQEADAADFRGPVIWGEWNSSAGPLAENHDDANNAAFIAGALACMEENADGSLFWNLTDIYEEVNYHFAPFHGGYGLYTVDDVPKSAARAFELFHRLPDLRLEVTGLPSSASRGALAATNNQADKLSVILWNHREGRGTRDWKTSLDLSAFKFKSFSRTEILPGAGSPYETWQKQGKPMTLSPAQLRQLHAASRPKTKSQRLATKGKPLEVTVAPGAAMLLEFSL
jgi:xylan 1,4-beta-xylosidase